MPGLCIDEEVHELCSSITSRQPKMCLYTDVMLCITPRKTVLPFISDTCVYSPNHLSTHMTHMFLINGHSERFEHFLTWCLIQFELFSLHR